MYCKNCGKVLQPGDKFCNECGTKVESSKSFETVNSGFSPMFKREMEGSVENTAPKRNFHTEDFNWNLDGYPTEQAKKTEEIDFNWESVLDERDRRIKEESSENLKNDERPDTVSRKEIAKPTIGQLEQQIFSEMGEKDNLEDPQKTVRIDKFYTFNKKNEEFQALLDKEYERLKNNQEAIDEEERHTPTVDEILSGAEPEESEETAEPAEATEPIEEEEIEEVSEEPELVGVALAGTPEGIVSLGDEIEDDTADEASAEEEHAEEAPAEEELAAATETPDGDKAEESEPAFDEETCPPSEEEKKPENSQSEEDEESEEKEPEHKLTFDDVFADDDDDDYKEPKKKHTFLKVIAIILCILVIAEVAVICITNFAPESGAAHWILSTFDSIKEMFTGGGEAKG